MSANRMAISRSPPWRLRLAAIGLDRARRRRQQRRHAVAAGRRAELAGQPHVRRRADPRQHLLLVGARAAAAWSRSAPPMRTRQVEQRPRPPHTEACGMPASRLISRMVRPAGCSTRCRRHRRDAPRRRAAPTGRAAAARRSAGQQQQPKPPASCRRCMIEVRRASRAGASRCVEQRRGKPGCCARSAKSRSAIAAPPMPADRQQQRHGIERRQPVRYQGFSRQAKCRPMQAWSQTTRGRPNWRTTPIQPPATSEASTQA